ncbi:MAG: hypothetical protein QME79_14840, partial [Bacillota bacterium]|nr:hypothetical protein [Bacillota bacterium]
MRMQKRAGQSQSSERIPRRKTAWAAILSLLALLLAPQPACSLISTTKHNLSVSGPGTIKATSE